MGTTHDRPPLRLWVGSYAEQGGAGLYPLTRASSGEWSVGRPSPAALNASFGAWSPRHRLHYLVDEQGGTIGALRPDGDWTPLARVPSGGDEPCHVALDPGEARLAVANYGSGSMALLTLDPKTGLPAGPPDVRPNAGSGPNPERQEGPHAHCVRFAPDGRWLYQVDLGTDEVRAFPCEGQLGAAEVAFRAPPGSGPRHLVFHPRLPVAFLVSELASTLAVLRVEPPRLQVVQTIRTLPAGDDAAGNLGGHIEVNAAGDRVYVTNRGRDGIAVFSFDGTRLSPLQHLSSGGASPRFFLLLQDERLMLVAHEESGNVAGFALAADGTLSPAGIDLPVPGAGFILRHPLPS